MSDSKQKVVSVTTQEYFVEGMHCAACEVLVSERMLEVPGVHAAEAKLVTKTVQITWDGQLDVEGLRLKGTELLSDVGYKLHLGDTAPGHVVAWRKLLLPLILALVIFGGFLLLQESPLTGLLSGTQATTLSFAFLLGLVASVSTCMAVVGGLVLSLSAKYARQGFTTSLLTFHAARLVAFLLLGGLLGLVGSFLVVSPVVYSLIQLLLAVVLIVMGLNLLGVNKLAAFQLHLPAGMSKRLTLFSQSSSAIWEPLLLGVATFFLPCAFTQSMQFQAIATGDIQSGALTMLVFALGTLPMLALISFASVKFAQSKFKQFFLHTAGFLVILFGILNLVGLVNILAANIRG